MYYVRVEGDGPEGYSTHASKPTNLEMALDDLDDMVYSAEAMGYGNLRIFWLDEANPDGWEDITDKYNARKGK